MPCRSLWFSAFVLVAGACAATPQDGAVGGFDPTGAPSDSADTEARESAGESALDATGGGTDDGGTTFADGTTANTEDDLTDGDAPIIFDFAIPDAAPVTGRCETVDLLFVIDNSGSMADEQLNLIASVPGFVSGIEATLGSETDYHVGVVSTDDNVFNTPGCQQLGALVVQTGGDLSSAGACGPYADGGGYMSKHDPLGGAQGRFDCAARLGIEGSGQERQMDALTAAIDPATQLSGCNQGFLRDDALLVVVLVSDEDDNFSSGQPIDWYRAVLAAKGGDEDKVVVLSLVGHHKPNDCIPGQWTGMQGAEIALRVIAFTEQFEHGMVGDVCSANYDRYFDEAIDGIATACGVAAG